MKNAFEQLLHILQQGLAAVFHFIEMVWGWTVTQIQSLTSVPWQAWPLSKQILLVMIVAAVAYTLFKVVSKLWSAGEQIVSAFSTLVSVFVRTVPTIAVAGAIALGGLWLLNNLDLSRVKLPLTWQSSAIDQTTVTHTRD